MDREEIRLECLKLATSKSPDLHEQMARVKVYYDYVVGPAPKPEEVKPGPKPGREGASKAPGTVILP